MERARPSFLIEDASASAGPRLNAGLQGGAVRRRGLVGGVGVRGKATDEVGDGGEPPRLAGLPTVRVDGRRVRLATTRRARLVGLALTDRSAAGPGLVIPSCRSIHTFGMRFPLDVAFLDAGGEVISRRRAVRPRRVVADRRASAVLETPAEDVA